MLSRIKMRPTIGVLAGWQLHDGNIHEFLNIALCGLYTAAQKQKCNLLLACGLGSTIGQGYYRPAWPIVSLDTDFVPVGSWNTDGLIVINPLISRERSAHIQQVRAQGHPVVFFGPGEEGSAVIVDNESGIRQAVAHLVEHGHQRIAFIAGHESSLVDADSALRLMAYRKVIQEYGLDTDPDLIVYGNHDLDRGRDAMRQLLESNIKFTAVLASNDDSAIGAMEVIRSVGLRIPQDVAVMGFDDRPEASGQYPPLASIHYPIFDAGQQALNLLLEIIAGHSTVSKVIQVPVHLIARESCGCLLDISKPVTSTISLDKKNAALTQSATIVQMIRDSVQIRTHFLTLNEIDLLCTRLVESFEFSLMKNDPGLFRFVFLGVLRRVEEVEDDPLIWYTALSILEESSFNFLETWDEATEQQTEEIFRQARFDISVSGHRQHRNHIQSSSYFSDQVSLLTSHLSFSVNENQIFEILTEYLPKIFINQVNLAFFEPEDNDPIAQSRLSSILPKSVTSFRFPTRQFPPAELFQDHQPLSLTIFPLVIHGVAEGYVGFDSIDFKMCATITQQLAIALRTVRLYQKSIEGRRLAEDANQIKSRFLSMISHELRTPLNLIVGLSKLILQEETPEFPILQFSRRSDIEQIHSNAEHLGRLIGDVLDLATSQAGQLHLELEPLNLADILQTAINAGEQLARQKGLGWKESIPANLPMVKGDRTRLRQVLLNLISNAVKFTERGQIEVRVEERESQVWVSVRDTGPGIIFKEQEVIFDEFRQSERITARGYGGMGLGLAISRHLVELHGGKIGVQSLGKEGAGSTFYFTLPVIQQIHEHKILANDNERFVVLLIADRTTGADQLQTHLVSQGFLVKVFQVDEPSWWLQTITPATQAVILDSSLAPQYGWEVMRALKQNPVTRDVSVIFYSLTDNRGTMLELDYLIKPVEPSDIIQALNRQGFSPGAASQKKTILIVDDDPGTLDLNSRIVQTQLPACRILQAHNGREALVMITRELPDLVLLDLMMPELDGFGVLDAMRTGESIREIPVIVLTGQAITEHDMARLNQGVAGVLQKEIFSAKETLAHIETALAHMQPLSHGMQNVIRKAIAYIHDHYAESISRKDMAQYVGVSERYLTRCLHLELGITPIEYLNRYRMKQAKAMLESGKSVSGTAFEVGFSNVSYFIKSFRKEVGMSPSAYQKLRLEK